MVPLALKVNPVPPVAEAAMLPLFCPVAAGATTAVTDTVTPAQGFGGGPSLPPPLLQEVNMLIIKRMAIKLA